LGKLTAILCADVFGYSRLMGDDEEAIPRTLLSYRKLIGPTAPPLAGFKRSQRLISTQLTVAPPSDDAWSAFVASRRRGAFVDDRLMPELVSVFD
jgi:hypothetical protein